MKLPAFLFAASVLLAQPSSPPSINFVTSDPAGACSLTVPLRFNTTNAKLWGCSGLTWTQIGGGGGGATIGAAISGGTANYNLIVDGSSNLGQEQYLGAARFPALTGDVTTTAGSLATAIGAGKVTNAMLAGSITAANLVGTDIATVGTITAGTWHGTVVSGLYGGTGTNNGSNTITLGNNLTTSGNFALTLTQTGTTNVTLPTSGTLITGSSPALTTPTITTSETLSNNGIANTSSDGYVLQNTTAAANNTQQWSPRLHWIGQGWKTASTAASQQVEWYGEVIPVQDSTNPGALLNFKPIVNGTTRTSGAIGFCNMSSTVSIIWLDGGNGNETTNCKSGGALTGIGSVGAAAVFGIYSNGTERANIGVNGIFFSAGQFVGWASGTQTSNNTGDTGLNRNAAGVVEVNNGSLCSSSASNCADLKHRHSLASGAAPTLTNGTGTIAGGDEAARITLTAGSQTTVTMTFGTAYSTAPVCVAVDETTAANNPVQAQPTTTTVVLNATGTFGAADKIAVKCGGF